MTQGFENSTNARASLNGAVASYVLVSKRGICGVVDGVVDGVVKQAFMVCMHDWNADGP